LLFHWIEKDIDKVSNVVSFSHNYLIYPQRLLNAKNCNYEKNKYKISFNGKNKER